MQAAFHHPYARLAAALLMAPFFLQLLGFGDTFLGGGLCGELFAGGDTPLAFQGAGFWYGLAFMLLLGFQLMYGGLLLLGRLLEMPESTERPIYRAGVWLAGLVALLFALTRTTGLPYPAAQGLALGEAAPLDLLSVILVALTLAGGGLLWALLRRRAAGTAV